MTNAELDEVYDTAHHLMEAGHWSTIDDLLEYYGLSAWRRDIDLLLGWAIATNICRKKLTKRKFFMEQCLKFHSDPETPKLWKNLWEDGTEPNERLKQYGWKVYD